LDLVSASTSWFFDRHVLPQCQEILDSGMMAEICMNYGRIEKIHVLIAQEGWWGGAAAGLPPSSGPTWIHLRIEK